MKREEAKIENDFVNIARTKGVRAIKFKDQSDTGAPDRICLRSGGIAFFIEFKKPGEAPRRKQLLYHKQLRNLGFRVYTHDNLQDALLTLHNELTNVDK
jgi:hypothetical protein